MPDRSAEFEQRYQALLRDEYKPHAPARLKMFLEGQAKHFLSMADAFRGKDAMRFNNAVASVEKCYQTIDLLDDVLKEKVA